MNLDSLCMLFRRSTMFTNCSLIVHYVQSTVYFCIYVLCILLGLGSAPKEELAAAIVAAAAAAVANATAPGATAQAPRAS